jgi:hypothetical protein
VSWFTSHGTSSDERPAAEQSRGPAAAVARPAPAPAPATPEGGRELFARHARKDGRLVAVLRAVDLGSSCTVEAEVYPYGSNQLSRPGPYTFPDAQQASAFVTEAVAALMYLGCDIQAE